MRIDLKTPFAEKDEAKALGARWDAAKKCWYIQDVHDVTPFSKWLPRGDETSAAPRPAAGARRDSAPGVRTGPKEAPHCGCDVLPWEPCVHTAAPP